MKEEGGERSRSWCWNARREKSFSFVGRSYIL